MIDLDYTKPFYSRERITEVLSLSVLLLSHVPALFFLPSAFFGMAAYLIAYYFVHKFCHYNPDNAKRWFKWHYLHHMGQNQDMNWGTLFPLADYIVGTSYLNKRNKK